MTGTHWYDATTDQRLLGRNNPSGGVQDVACDITASQALDWIGSTRGAVLYRGVSGWAILPPGTSGHVLQSGGAGADPSYAAPVGGSGNTLYAPGSVTVATGNFQLHIKRLQLTTTQRLTAAGTGRFRLSN